MPKLIIRNGSVTTIHDIAGERTSIGRHSDNDIVIADGSVSSHHGEIVTVDDAWLLLDLRSSNGTRVNGENASTKKLNSDDTILFGAVECLFQAETVMEINGVPSRFTPPIDKAIALPKGLQTMNDHAQRIVVRLKQGGWSKAVLASVFILLIGVALRMTYVAGKQHDHRSSSVVVAPATPAYEPTDNHQYPRVGSFPTTEEAMHEEVQSLNANSAYGYPGNQSSNNGWGSSNSDVQALPHY